MRHLPVRWIVCATILLEVAVGAIWVLYPWYPQVWMSYYLWGRMVINPIFVLLYGRMGIWLGRRRAILLCNKPEYRPVERWEARCTPQLQCIHSVVLTTTAASLLLLSQYNIGTCMVLVAIIGGLDLLGLLMEMAVFRE
jgi:hypothetical protein